MDNVKEFLQSSTVLLVDQNPVSRAYLQKLAIELEMDPKKTVLARDLAEARDLVPQRAPAIIICDDSIGLEGVIEVLQAQRKVLKNSCNLVFFYLSGNSSQAVIGRAAEEEIDGFILKPFTRTEFIRVFTWVAQEKLNPTDYQKQLQIGRDHLFSGNVDPAIESFEKALRLSDSPVTAHFYLGQAHQMRKLLQQAKGSYRSGISLNQVHCRCLLGMFDVLVTESKNEEAYEVLRRIVSLFPANPGRLSTALSMAVKTGNFRDVENYYEYFTAMDGDHRTPELRNHLCSALAVNGKYHLIKSSKKNAIVSFERALTQGQGQEKFYSYVVETLLKYGLTDEADEFASKFKSLQKKRAA